MEVCLAVDRNAALEHAGSSSIPDGFHGAGWCETLPWSPVDPLTHVVGVQAHSGFVGEQDIPPLVECPRHVHFVKSLRFRPVDGSQLGACSSSPGQQILLSQPSSDSGDAVSCPSSSSKPLLQLQSVGEAVPQRRRHNGAITSDGSAATSPGFMSPDVTSSLLEPLVYPLHSKSADFQLPSNFNLP
ncbi:unnamed protein product [Pieris macdunnoughi]|uniref:Uncharacterized protein n=1 Tax=Pieris macdunnoughi TaxID=345717 RepID=A0A821W4U7_9NEOP|nr:unnamed protein product [Pieris macdunnoughi]